MTAAASVALWRDTLLALAAGAAAVASLAWLTASACRTGAARRTVWRASVVSLVLLVVAELAGVSGALVRWLHDASAALPTTDADVATVGKVALPPGVPPAEAPAGLSPPVANPVQADTDSAEVPTSDESAFAWWPGVLWLLGTILVTARAGMARLLLQTFRRRHPAVAEAGLTGRVRDVACRLGLDRPVQVLEAESLLGPVAFGVWRPTVALPAGFAETFPPQQQEAMLAHELAHLAARDPAWHLLADLAVAILWWHPLAWWARHRLRAAAEDAADEASLVVADGPGVLAACLVELGARLAAGRSPGWVPMAGFRSGLGRRVERLLRLEGAAWRPPGRLRAAVVLTLGPAVLLTAAALPSAWARARAFSEGDDAMSNPWNRSLAAAVLVAALGTHPGPTLLAEPPQGPGPGGGGGPPAGGGVGGGDSILRPTPGGEGADHPRARVEEQRIKLGDVTLELDRIKERVHHFRAVLEKDQDAAGAVREELDKLVRKAAELQRQKERLEAELRELEAKQAEASTRIMVFRLKHRDPEEVQAVLVALLPAPQAARAPSGGGPGGMMGPGRPGSGAVAGAGGPGMAKMMGMGGGMAAGMPGMGVVGYLGGTWRLAVDPRTRSVIIRGTDKDLRMAQDLIEALDGADGAGAVKLKNVRIFRLKHASADEVQGILQTLDIKATVAAAPKGRLLVVAGPEGVLKEVADVIEALDVESKSGKGGGKGDEIQKGPRQ